MRHSLCFMDKVLCQAFVNIPNVRRLQFLKVIFEAVVIQVVSFKHVCNEGITHIIVGTEFYSLVLNALKRLE